MALYKRPLTAILDAVRALNSVTLVENQYTFGAPEVMEEPTEKFNTTMLITAIVPDSPYEQAVTVQYLRLNLADLATLIPLPVAGLNFQTTLDVALKMNSLYGMNFTADDIESTPLTLVAGAGQALLKAKVGSLGWIGEVIVQVIKGDYPINTYLTVKTLPGLDYPSHADDSKPYAEMYSYWRNFSAVALQLESIPLGSGALDVLATALRAVTGDAWTITGTGRFSLAGASVEYNGPTAGQDDFNKDYVKGMRVTLGASNLGYSGQLMIHSRLAAEEFPED